MKNYTFDIVISALCGFVIISKIDSHFLNVSAFIILLSLSSVRGLARKHEVVNFQVLFFKSLLVLFTILITYLLFLKLN